MVSQLLVDTLADPTRALIELYDPQLPIDDFPKSVSAHFSNVFVTPHAFNEIPVLDVQNPPECRPDRALVRFRAMIQDTSPSPELYVAIRGAGPGGWGLPNDVQDDASIRLASLRDCMVVWAVNVPGETDWCSKELNGGNNGESNRVHHALQPHKFPLPAAPHIGVQVKIYDTSSAELLKITDVVTFVGFLTSEPLHSETSGSIEVPTLHVLFSQPLPPTLVPRSYPMRYDDVLRFREELVDWVANEALAGDRDAAEWVLLTSIARVQSRTPPILPPSLTICQFPSSTSPEPTCPTLIHVLSLILPLASFIPMTLPLLNDHPFAPESKDENLHSGILQVPVGSRVIITESGVREGTVGEKGVFNLRATQGMINAQTLAYKFPYSEFTFGTDVTFIILSEGKKSALFRTSITVPLRAKDDSKSVLYRKAEELNIPAQETLERWRALIGGALVGAGSIIISEETSKYIQEDFVNERQQSKEITSEDLSLRMSLAKLMTLSMHGTEVTGDVWERVKTLDRRRKARLSTV